MYPIHEAAEQWERLLHRARITNARRDLIENRDGLATPNDAGVSETIRTAMAALRAAVVANDWDAVVEAYVLLEGIAQ